MIRKPAKTIVLILGLLLVCLCASRGEGLHLLPFALADESSQATGAELGNSNSTYYLSKAPESKFSFDHPSQHGLDPVTTCLSRSPFREAAYSHAIVEPALRRPPLILYSRSYLTSIGDSSPPSSVSNS